MWNARGNPIISRYNEKRIISMLYSIVRNINREGSENNRGSIVTPLLGMVVEIEVVGWDLGREGWIRDIILEIYLSNIQGLTK